jgi:hypothetical protein
VAALYCFLGKGTSGARAVEAVAGLATRFSRAVACLLILQGDAFRRKEPQGDRRQADRRLTPL